MNNNQKLLYDTKREMTQQKALRHQKTLDDSPYLVNQQQHFQAGVSVDQNPLHQRVSGGLRCVLYHAHSIRKRYGIMEALKPFFFLGKRTARRREIVPLMECGTLWR